MGGGRTAREARAEAALRDFLKKASDAERKLVASNRVSKVWAFTAEGVDGELADVEGREIHLVLSRSKERRQPQAPQPTSQLYDRWWMGLRQSPRRTTVYTDEAIPISTTTTAGPRGMVSKAR